MADALYGGSLNGFADSMAQEIEKALDEARIEAGFGPLPAPGNEDDLKNRRVLFIAIARGVINHLAKHQQAFEISVKVAKHPKVKAHPVINVKKP